MSYLAEVRVVGVEDWAAWRELRLEALDDAPLGFVETLEQALEKDEAAWRRRMREVPLSVLATDGPRPVGMSAGFLVEGRPFLGAVYVTPAWRGRGLLERLLEPVVQWAREQAAAELVLEVHEDNPRAQAAYRRLGFVDTGQRRPYPLPPGGSEAVMTRPLQQRRRALPVDSRLRYRRGLLRGAPC